MREADEMIDMKETIDKILDRAKAADDAGHSAAASELYRRAILLGVTKDSIKYRAVINLLEVGRVRDAEIQFNEINQNAAPKPWLLEYALGKISMAQFNPMEAERHFRTAWKLNPDSTAPAELLADCLLKQEKFDEAIAVLNEALKASGDVDEVYLNLAVAKRAVGDYKSARQYLLDALKIDPNNSSIKKLLLDVELCLEVIHGG